MEQQERGIVAKLEFPLPECREEFEVASHAMDIKGVVPPRNSIWLVGAVDGALERGVGGQDWQGRRLMPDRFRHDHMVQKLSA